MSLYWITGGFTAWIPRLQLPRQLSSDSLEHSWWKLELPCKARSQTATWILRKPQLDSVDRVQGDALRLHEETEQVPSQPQLIQPCRSLPQVSYCKYRKDPCLKCSTNLSLNFWPKETMRDGKIPAVVSSLGKICNAVIDEWTMTERALSIPLLCLRLYLQLHSSFLHWPPTHSPSKWSSEGFSFWIFLDSSLIWPFQRLFQTDLVTFINTIMFCKHTLSTLTACSVRVSTFAPHLWYCPRSDLICRVRVCSL